MRKGLRVNPPAPGSGRSPARPACAAAPHHEVAGEVVLPIVVRVLHGLDSLDEFPQDLLLAHPAPPAALRSGSPGHPPALRLEPPPPHDPSPGCLPSLPCLASTPPGPARGLLAPLWLGSRPAHGRPAARSILPSLRPTLPGAADTDTTRPRLLSPAHARRRTRPLPVPRPSLQRSAPLALPTAAPPYWRPGTPITGQPGFEGAFAGLRASPRSAGPPSVSRGWDRPKGASWSAGRNHLMSEGGD